MTATATTPASRVTAAWAVAVAEVRDRAGRPVFLLMVLGALALGYVAIPPESAGYAMVKVGSFRGTYDSGYVGTMLAMIGSLWLPLFGFYTLRNVVMRDATGGVGEILAATPLSGPVYLLGKCLGNFAILAVTVGALAIAAPAMQLLRGESTTIDPMALWLPLALFCIPALAVAAAVSVVFETIPILRGGIGNIVWFFGYPAMFLAVLPLLYGDITTGFRNDMVAQHPGANDEISIGLTAEHAGLGRFDWSGTEFGHPVLLGSAGAVLIATLVAIVPALWFARFDPARSPLSNPDRPTTSDAPPPAAAFSRTDAPWEPAERGNSFVWQIAGELRILLGGVSPWWWLGIAVVTAAALVAPADGAGTVLLVAWLLPVLLWSRIGTHAAEAGVEQLLCGVSFRRRMIAEWGAGAIVAATTGSGPLVRMLLASDTRGIAAWIAGVALIPALALLLGSLGRSPRVFQAVYLVLWYAVLNGVSAVDFMGAHRADGIPTGPSPVSFLAVAAALTAAALLVQEVRHARR